MPRPANGIRPIRSRSVISTQLPAAMPHAERRAGRVQQRDRDAAPSGRRSAPWCGSRRAACSGVSRSWRFQPSERSAAIRAPVAEHRVHRPERRQPDHEVQRRVDAAAAEVVLVPVGRRDHEVEDQREADREDEEAPVAERARDLEAGVGRRCSCGLRPRRAVSSRNASSRPAPGDLDVAGVGERGEQRADGGVGVGAREHDRLAAPLGARDAGQPLELARGRRRAAWRGWCAGRPSP